MVPADKEKRRLDALLTLNVLHTPKEERFDRITRVAREVTGSLIAGIGLMDKDSIWFKSAQGLSLEEIPKEGSLTKRTIENGGLTTIEDASVDETLKNNPLVKDFGVKFYIGYPIMTPEGYGLGDFFIAGHSEVKLGEKEKLILNDLSLMVQDEVLHGKILVDEQKMRVDLVSRNQELARQKARSDAMLSNIGDGVIGINDKGEIIFVNDQVEKMTGYYRPELVGKMIIQAIRMVDSNGAPIQTANQPIRQALFYNKKVANEQYFYERRDRSRFPVAITATPVVVFNQIIGGVVIFRDVTKEKEVDRMKTEFISLASHQLRTPLSAMKWFSEILMDGDAGQLNNEQKEILGNIYRSNERMIELVNTLLNISRIESGRIMIDPQPTDLKKLVEEVVLEIKQRTEKKRHHLAISVHGALPTVSIDPKLVRHVYLNLLTNAIKYTPEGGDIIVIISRSGENIISQVSDNGLGIPKDQQKRVFNKFFRAENIIKYETEGTGLGLYLAKAIVESSGGTIWFKSEEGKGTTFWFSVPMSVTKKEGVVSIDS